MKKKAFISGPILGMENNQGYRKIISEICVKLGYNVVDPWQREKVLYKGDKQCWWNQVPAEGFICRDLKDAELCDVMIVYLPRLSAGACMELFYAKRKGKKVVVVSELECLSPWIVAHANMVVKGWGELEEALKHLW
jgi:nucleoside 2-deoxyribosyltransferase